MPGVPGFPLGGRDGEPVPGGDGGHGGGQAPDPVHLCERPGGPEVPGGGGPHRGVGEIERQRRAWLRPCPYFLWKKCR